ncbi:MAG: flagellar export protein FliJ [Pseudomonadota bacterium]
MNPRRLEPLIDLAHGREQEAARGLAVVAGTLAQQEQRLAELVQYADEYAAANGITDPAALRNRLAFRECIEDALVRQAKVVDQIRANCDLERTRVMLAGRDMKVLEKLASSYRSQERHREQGREQRQLDELAARGHLARRQETGEKP